jgi:hypothetical protein
MGQFGAKAEEIKKTHCPITTEGMQFAEPFLPLTFLCIGFIPQTCECGQWAIKQH